jgi:hypothetical protein
MGKKLEELKKQGKAVLVIVEKVVWTIAGASSVVFATFNIETPYWRTATLLLGMFAFLIGFSPILWAFVKATWPKGK